MTNWKWKLACAISVLFVVARATPKDMTDTAIALFLLFSIAPMVVLYRLGLRRPEANWKWRLLCMAGVGLATWGTLAIILSGRDISLFVVGSVLWVIAAVFLSRRKPGQNPKTEEVPAKTEEVPAKTEESVQEQVPEVARFRGTVTKVPGEAPGSVFVNAEHRPFVLIGVWKSAVPPAENQSVEVELDNDGKVTSLAVVGAPLSATGSRQPEQADRTKIAMATSENRSSPAPAPSTPLQEVKRPPRAGRFLRTAFALVVLLVVGGVLAWPTIIQPAILRQFPSISIQRAAKAYQDHDLATFRDYVDLPAIFEDAAGQALPDVFKDLAVDKLTPDFVALVEGIVDEGSSSSNSTGAETFVHTILRRSLRELSYTDLASTRLQGNVARVELRMALGRRMLPIQARLHWRNDHWRVVAIEELDGLALKLIAAAL